ncbi:MAG: hypothetical protein ACSHWW_02610 [Nonlabens sp.]|uniref:hypothetical protein n=1 Tax=Nonlabens sp. TaxID=1888209 RepID=UPI003EF24D2C
MQLSELKIKIIRLIESQEDKTLLVEMLERLNESESNSHVVSDVTATYSIGNNSVRPDAAYFQQLDIERQEIIDDPSKGIDQETAMGLIFGD